MDWNNGGVYAAAVQAIGSNSRSWATYLRNQTCLFGMLGDLFPDYTVQAIRKNRLTIEDLKAALPGQSSSNDACAIVKWAELLNDNKDYYQLIQELGKAMRLLYEDNYNQELDDDHLLLCLVGYLGDPPKNWPVNRYLSEQYELLPSTGRKLPGMRYALASEFLRNLGWNGFKPDRHIIRLFDIWFPHGQQSRFDEEACRLMAIIHRHSKPLKDYLTYSMVGMNACPAGEFYSHADDRTIW